MALDHRLLTALGVIVVVALIVYMLDPTLGGILAPKAFDEPFETLAQSAGPYAASASAMSGAATHAEQALSGAAEHAEQALSGAAAHVMPSGASLDQYAPVGGSDAVNIGGSMPANCYPQDNLNPAELLPKDPNSKWAQQNPAGQGDLEGKNFLPAGHNVGIDTVSSSMRNPNLQLRSDPPIPQNQNISPWNISTNTPDVSRREFDMN
jgi:hypothetical protein